MQSFSVDFDTPFHGAFDDDSHIAKSLQGGQAVLSLKETLHLRDALSERAQHDGTVGNRLVARHPDSALHRTARLQMIGHLSSIHSRDVGFSFQYFVEVLPRSLSPREHAQQHLSVTTLDRLPNTLKALGEVIQHSKRGIPIS